MLAMTASVGRHTTLVIACWFIALVAFVTQGEEITLKAFTDVQRETILHTLIAERKFKGAMERLHDHPEEASIMLRFTWKGKLVYKHLPLHQAFLVDFPDDMNKVTSRGTMPKEQVDLILHLIELNPLATEEKDDKDRLPLHCALMSPNPPPVEVVNALIKESPNSLRARGVENRVALHMAAAFPMTSYENTKAVMEAFPDAVDIQDEDESLPLHLASWGGNFPDAYPVVKMMLDHKPSLLKVVDGDQETPLTLMAKYGRTSAEAAGYLLRLDPKAVVNDRDEFEGNTVLHHAVASSHDQNSTIYQPFLGIHPEMAMIPNRVKKLPLHVSVWKCCANPQMILELIDVSPQAVSMPDEKGMLPLHHACNVGVADDAVVEKLIELHPKGVKTIAQGHLPLHYALAHPAREGEEVERVNRIILRLLKEFPAAAKIRDDKSGLYPFHTAVATKRNANILKLLMSLAPETVHKTIKVKDEGESEKNSTALHYFAKWSQTYLTKAEIRDVTKEFIKTDPEGPSRRDEDGQIPLHSVWTQWRLHDEEKRVLADILIEAFPQGVESLDNKNRTPLSHACHCRDAGGVDMLLKLHPFAASIKSDLGRYPLHILSDLGAKGYHTGKLDRLMTALLDRYPKAASEPDSFGNLPLHYLSKSAGIDHFDEVTIVRLIEAYPDATKTANDLGQYPLNLAVETSIDRDEDHECDYWIGLFDALLNADPDGAMRGPKGQTPFSVGLKSVNSLSHRRRHEHDHAIYIMRRLYSEHPESALLTDRRGRNALHHMMWLIGDMGGSVAPGWTRLALDMLEHYPELAVGVGRDSCTPLCNYILHLSDTAVQARDDQHPETTELTDDLTKIMSALLTAHPHALTMKEEFGNTPIDLALHRRVKYLKGSHTYLRSQIMKMIRRHLRRGVEYWEKISGLEHALADFRKRAITCEVLLKALKGFHKQTTEMVEELDFDPAPLDDDQETCTVENRRLCAECAEGHALLRQINNNIDIWTWASDERSDEEDLKPLEP